jgi:hypothetical protein
MFDVS